MTGSDVVKPLLSVRNASIEYKRGDRSIIKAVNDVSLDLKPGEIINRHPIKESLVALCLQ